MALTLDTTTQTLLTLLHRGGAYGYWWTLEQRQSYWWETTKRTPLPRGEVNIYFGVHPTTEIPQTNPRGEPAPSRAVRAQLGVIAALNCLYTEFDAKDFPDGKNGAYAKAAAMEPPPSVLVDSGGGYHLYWLFDEPWILGGEEDREAAKRLQAAWVAYAGGDAAVKDLARVLRVPGTRNLKYDPAPVVTVVFADFDRRFTHDELTAFCREEWSALSTPRATEGQHVSSSPNGTGNLDRYARAALDGEVATVLRAQAGMKHDTIRNAAIKLGTLIARDLLDETTAFNELSRAADLHRADVKDTERTIRDGIAYGKLHPRTLPEPKHTDDSSAAHVDLSAAPADEPTEVLPLLIRADALSEIPPANALVPNLIYVNTLHQWFGAPGSGKSFLALDIAATLAQGFNVVYVAAEAIEDYESRLDAWKAHHKTGAGELYFWRQPLALASEGDVQRFIAAVQALGPALIVLDPLADCMTGLDESSAKDMSIVVYALNTIRRATRSAILVVHHTGWNTDHERGHSILRGACRVVVKIEAREDGLIRLVCEKKNHGRKFDPRSFRLVSAGTMGGALPLPARLVMAGKLRLSDRHLRVLEAMTTEPLRKGATHTQLVQDTQIPAGSMNRILTALADAQYIRSEDRGRTVLYNLLQAGRDAMDLEIESESQSWAVDGREMEEGGRTWNWTVAGPLSNAANTPSTSWKNESGRNMENTTLSSTVLPHQDAVLPNPSKTLPTHPEYIYPTDIYSGLEQDAKNASTSESHASDESWEYVPFVPDEPTVKGYRALDWFDEPEPATLVEPEPDADESSIPFFVQSNSETGKWEVIETSGKVISEHPTEQAAEAMYWNYYQAYLGQDGV